MSQPVDSDRCAEVLEVLEAWIDGDLDGKSAAAVQEHVDRCASCRSELESAEIVVAELRALPSFEVPQSVLRTVRREIEPRASRSIRRFLDRAVSRPVPAVAAIAVVVLLVVIFGPRRRPPEPRFSEREVVQAVEETKLALAYVGDIARRAEIRVRQRVLDEGVKAGTVRGLRRPFQIIGGRDPSTVEIPATPQPDVKGS